MIWKTKFRKQQTIPMTASILKRLVFMLPLTGILSCATQLPEPPIALPFFIHKKGAVTASEFYIKDEGYYSFSLRYNLKNNQSVEEVVGNPEVDQIGNPKNSGVPTPIQLKVVQMVGDKTEYEHIILNIEEKDFVLSSWGGGNYSKKIKVLPLVPGHYRYTVISMSNIEELKDVQVEFLITQTYLGK